MAEPEYRYVFLIGNENFDTNVRFNSGDGRGHDSEELVLETKRGIQTNAIIIADIQAYESLLAALNGAREEFYKRWAELPECCQKQYGG